MTRETQGANVTPPPTPADVQAANEYLRTCASKSKWAILFTTAPDDLAQAFAARAAAVRAECRRVISAEADEAWIRANEMPANIPNVYASVAEALDSVAVKITQQDQNP